jgi:glycosyltransferase involved in cell wall biosynthesis
MQKKRKRVLLIHGALAPYRIDLLNELGELYDLRLLLLREQVSYHLDLSQRLLTQSLRIPFAVLQGNRLFFSRDIPFGLRKVILDNQADVVVTSEFSLPTGIALFQRFIGPRSFGHVLWSEANPWSIRHFNWWRSMLRAVFARHVDSLVLYSIPSRAAFCKKYSIPSSKVFRCANHQLEENLLSSCERGVASIQSELRSRNLDGRSIILYVGRLAPEKNLFRAIRSFASLVRNRTDSLFVIVGSGSEANRLKKLTMDLGITESVYFVGHRQGSELHAWYQAASVFVLPSTYEPYGAVVAEALVCGVPVICSRNAGACALIHPSNGIRFSPEVQGELENAFHKSERWFRPASTLLASTRRGSLCPVSFRDDLTGLSDAIDYAAACAQSRLGEGSELGDG